MSSQFQLYSKLGEPCPVCQRYGEDPYGHRCSKLENPTSPYGGIITCYHVFNGQGLIKEGVCEVGQYAVYKLSEYQTVITSPRKIEDEPIFVVKEKNTDIASVEKLDKVYRSLMKHLRLSDQHKKYLTENLIEDAPYVSFVYPKLMNKFARLDIPDKIRAELGFDILEGVPGFGLKKTGRGLYKWYLFGNEGMAMPIYQYPNGTKRIVGFQIKNEHSFHNSKGGKYSALSSKEWNKTPVPKGCSPGTPIHIACPKEYQNNIRSYPKKKPIVITEGVKKADIACKLSNNIYIGLLGVNSQDGLLEILEQITDSKEHLIYIAFDMDSFDNENVEYAYKCLFNQLLYGGYGNIKVLRWDPKYKGIDDAYIHGQVPDICDPILIEEAENKASIWITEGTKCPKVSSKLLNRTFIGLPSIHWQKGILDKLKAVSESSLVVFAFDIKVYKNQPNAFKQLAKSILSAGYTISIAKWDGYSRIDHALVSNDKPKVKKCII